MDRNKETAVIHEYISRLGMVVQKERLAKNLTLDEIAFRSDISSHYMKRIIAGKRDHHLCRCIRSPNEKAMERLIGLINELKHKIKVLVEHLDPYSRS